MLHLIIPHDFNLSEATLREKIQYFLHKKGWRHANLSSASGIDKGTLSSLMSGARKFNVEHIEKIARALELDEKELFSNFLNECFDEKLRLKLSKCEKFLLKIATIKDSNLLNEIIESLMEQSSKNVSIIFNVAEQLYNNKMFFESVPLYRYTVSNIKNRLDIKLATSYYRLFMCSRNNLVNINGNINDCKQALLSLLDHIELLPIEYKLEAYIEIIVFYYLMEDSQNTIKYADRLIELTEILQQNLSKNNLDEGLVLDYYYEALLYKGFAFKALGEYENALSIINQYEKYNEKYSSYAKGNKHLVKILMGELDHIEKYLSSSSNPKKKVTVFPVVLESCIKYKNHNFLKDYIERNVDSLIALNSDETLLGKKHRMKAYQYLGLYYLQIEQVITGIEYILETMKLASFFQNQTRIKECWRLFAQYLDYATQEQKNIFNEIIGQAI